MAENRDMQPFGAEPLNVTQIGQYVAIARRRKWWVVFTAITIFFAGCAISVCMPDLYRSETTIFVDPQKVPDSYVPSTVSSSITDRLSTINQQVHSPTRLSQLRKQLDLFPEMKGPGSDERAVVRMNNAITVDLTDSGGQRLRSFRISYTSQDPVEAAKVANELAGMVMQENSRIREQQFSETASFLDSELQDTKKQLEQKEAEMAQIRGSAIMDLPESKQYHLEQLANLRIQLQNSQDRVTRAHQEKIYLQTLSASVNPTVDLDAAGAPSDSSPESSQIQKLEGELSGLRARYGENYPDVRKKQAQLDKLKSQAAQRDKNAPVQSEPVVRPLPERQRNPVLEGQLYRLDQEIAEQDKAQRTLQTQIDFHASKLQQEPIFEQKIVGLMRDYDTLKAHYNRLLDKKLTADMASELQTRGQEEHFIVLDRAIVPDRPYGPNRPFTCLASLILGIACGIGLAVFVDLADESVKDEREVAEIFGKAVLAGIPQILSDRQIRWRRLGAAGAVLGTAVCSAALGVLMFYASRWIS